MAPALLAPVAPAAAALVAPRPRARGAPWRPGGALALQAVALEVRGSPVALARCAPVCATFRRPVGDWRPGGPNGRDRPCGAPVAVAAEWRWRLRPAVASGPAAGGVAADGVAVALDGAPQWRPPGTVAPG